MILFALAIGSRNLQGPIFASPFSAWEWGPRRVGVSLWESRCGDCVLPSVFLKGGSGHLSAIRGVSPLFHLAVPFLSRRDQRGEGEGRNSIPITLVRTTLHFLLFKVSRFFLVLWGGGFWDEGYLRILLIVGRAVGG